MDTRQLGNRQCVTPRSQIFERVLTLRIRRGREGLRPFTDDNRHSTQRRSEPDLSVSRAFRD